MLEVKSTKLSDSLGLKCFNFEFVIFTIHAKNTAGQLSAILLPTHCLHSTNFPTRQEPNWAYLRNVVRDEIGEYLYQKTERRPMVLPVIIEV